MPTSAAAKKKVAPKQKAVSADFLATFESLKQVLKPYEPKCQVMRDGPQGYELYSKKKIYQGRQVYFAAVKIQKNYVSFYLMTVYGSPKQRALISPALKKHMQGKACFNFKSPEPVLMKELSALVKAGSKLFLDVDELNTAGMKCD